PGQPVRRLNGLVAYGGGQALHSAPTGTYRESIGDAVQEACQRGRPANRAGAVGQDEEGRLEHVLGRVGVVQDPTADVEDHRAMTADERGERIVASPCEEVGQKLLIG